MDYYWVKYKLDAEGRFAHWGIMRSISRDDTRIFGDVLVTDGINISVIYYGVFYDEVIADASKSHWETLFDLYDAGYSDKVIKVLNYQVLGVE